MAFERFEDAESYIKSHSSEAIRAIDKWERFQRQFVRDHPEVAHDFAKITSSGSTEHINSNWAEFSEKHPEFNFHANEAKAIHDGMILQQAWQYVRREQAS